MLFQDLSNSSLTCSSCGLIFPPGYTEIPCPKCGSTAFKQSSSPESDGPASPLAIHISVHKSYSLDHIESAARFARMSAAVEKEFGGDYITAVSHGGENEAYVVASIFAAAAFLEATINELFADAADDYESRIKKSDSNVAELMASLWKLEIPRTASFSIIRKYQVALALAKKELFDAGTSVYQNVDLLVTLRNYLIHAEPENVTWFTIGDIEAHKPTSRKLAEGLKGKFPISKLMEGLGNPFFPDKVIGHGCAKWAVESSLKFTDDFFSWMDLKPPYDAFRDRLKAV